MTSALQREATTRRWRRVEYERLVDLGVFVGERLELLDGLLVVREPQGSSHAAMVMLVGQVLHPSTAALVVEVADTSLRLDRRFKAAIYARAGLREYWIVNLTDRTLEVHRDPMSPERSEDESAYRSLDVLRPPASVAPLAAPGARIAVADLLP